MLCFFETPVLRLVLLPYYHRYQTTISSLRQVLVSKSPLSSKTCYINTLLPDFVCSSLDLYDYFLFFANASKDALVLKIYILFVVSDTFL